METELEYLQIDKVLLQQRFRGAMDTYDTHAEVQMNMASILVKMASIYIPAKHQQMLELGCGTGLLTNEVVQNFICDKYVANDLVAEVEERIRIVVGTQSNAAFNFVQGDVETMRIPPGQDVIWSGATLQWVSELGAFFERLSTALNHKGYVAISSFDIDNYYQVRAITGKGIVYKTMEEVMGRAHPYFKIVDSKRWQQHMWFDSAKQVLKHMRCTGVNAVSNTQWGKRDLEQFNTGYKRFKQQQGYPLTYNPFVMILQKR